MNRRFVIAFAVLVGAVPARASAECCFGFGGGTGFGFRIAGNVKVCISGCGPCCTPCGPCGGPCGPGAGPGTAPWYLYWPYDAYFQVPAPITYPFWPAPQVPPPAPAALQPAAYYPTGPSYWYGGR
jgi:hypothetical protein